MRTQSTPVHRLWLVPLLLMAGCRDDAPDAYGNFEASEVVVSAEMAGQLQSFGAEEGVRLAAGAAVGAIDITPLLLERQELTTRREAARARVAEVDAQADVLVERRRIAARAFGRTRRLFAAGAATAQELDQAEQEFAVLGEQIEALRAKREAAESEIGSIDAQIAQTEHRLHRSRVVNPVEGMVLATYAEPGEFVQAGQPLYRIADLRVLTLRAYVSGAQLAGVRIGEKVHVRVDGEQGGLEAVTGEVVWISDKAEFTPTPIQTREERTAQVYAVKVRVRNPDGALKIGMPGELVFGDGPKLPRTGSVVASAQAGGK